MIATTRKTNQITGEPMKPTGKEIARKWIQSKAEKGEKINEVIIERELKLFALRNFGVMHSTASWGRFFRFVRDEFNLKELPKEKYKTWIVE